jgi:hypothetical protein
LIIDYLLSIAIKGSGNDRSVNQTAGGKTVEMLLGPDFP